MNVKGGCWTTCLLGHVGKADDLFQKQQKHEQTAAKLRLSEIRKQVGEEIHEQSWASMYLKYLMTRINDESEVAIAFSVVFATDPPDITRLSIRDNASAIAFDHLAVDIQLNILEQRSRDVRVSTNIIRDNVERLVDVLASGNIPIPRLDMPLIIVADIKGDPSGNELAFRAVDENNYAPFFEDAGDIRCSNWRAFHIADPLWSTGAEQHVTQTPVPTNYISMSLSPRRMWNIVRKREAKVRQRIAIIDLRVLKRLGIAYGSTTDELGFSHYNPGNGTGTMFATKYHHLVLGWLPARAMLGSISCSEFEGVLADSHIDTSTETGAVSIKEYDKKVTFGLISQYLLESILPTARI